jgi:hypothetical protein
VDRFLADARGILETAFAAEGPESELTILVDEEDSIRILETAGVPLAALQQELGARTAFRVKRTPSMVQVEGRSGSQSCLLQQKRQYCEAQRLLKSITTSALRPALLLAEATTACSDGDLADRVERCRYYPYDSHSASSSLAYSTDAYNSK